MRTSPLLLLLIALAANATEPEVLPQVRTELKRDGTALPYAKINSVISKMRRYGENVYRMDFKVDTEKTKRPVSDIRLAVSSDDADYPIKIDAEGRYKVKMPYDVGSKKGLSSSRWIRMAQSYAGAGYGQHFPLHKGTEVLITHIDGDPDRPLVIGSVPNAVTPGPVADANAIAATDGKD